MEPVFKKFSITLNQELNLKSYSENIAASNVG